MSPPTYRTPAWAGSFYPANVHNLQNQIKHVAQTTLDVKKGLRGIIMPHAGYIYSGRTASYAEQDLKEKQPTHIILLGPDHHVGMGASHISQKDFWLTPLGKVSISKNSQLLQHQHPGIFKHNVVSEEKEHSLEVIVPFLQTWLHNFDLLPIVTGQIDPHQLATAITPLLSDDTVLVVSSDLSHFLTDRNARNKDADTIESILNLKHNDLAINNNKACGLVPICSLLSIAQSMHWQPRLLHYSNSGEVSGDNNRVVGYATIGFYAEDTDEHNG